jgi:hypothetical protein
LPFFFLCVACEAMSPPSSCKGWQGPEPS